MDYEALQLPLFLPLLPSLRLHPLSIPYAGILFVTSEREMACLTCIWERMAVQCALPPCRREDGMEGARMPRMVQPENPPLLLPSQLLLCFFLPRFITFQGGGTTATADFHRHQLSQLMWSSGRIILPSFLSCCYLTELKQLFRADYQE